MKIELGKKGMEFRILSRECRLGKFLQLHKKLSIHNRKQDCDIKIKKI
jgi:hypothetical protein